MAPLYDQKLPVETVRDLLGIARVMYRSARARGASAQQLAELAKIGDKLRTALDLSKTTPGTLGHRSAWNHAEDGLALLILAVGADDKVAELLAAAGDGLRK